MNQQLKRRPERIDAMRDKAVQTLLDLRKVAREGHLKGDPQVNAKNFNISASRWATWCLDRINRMPDGITADTLEEAKDVVTNIATEGEEYLELEGFHPVVDRFCAFVRSL